MLDVDADPAGGLIGSLLCAPGPLGVCGALDDIVGMPDQILALLRRAWARKAGV